MQPLYTCTRPLCGPKNTCRATRRPSDPRAFLAAHPSSGTRARLETRSPGCGTHCRTRPMQGCSTSREPSPNRPASARRRPLCGPVLAAPPHRHPRVLPRSAHWSIVYKCTRCTTAMGGPVCRKGSRRAWRRECLGLCNAGGAGRHHHVGPRRRPGVRTPAIPASGGALRRTELSGTPRNFPCLGCRCVPCPSRAEPHLDPVRACAARPRAISRGPMRHSRRGAPEARSLARGPAPRKCGDRA